MAFKLKSQGAPFKMMGASTTKDSPARLWSLVGQGLKQGGKYLLKNWKSISAGEAAFYGAEKMLTGEKKKPSESEMARRKRDAKNVYNVGKPKY